MNYITKYLSIFFIAMIISQISNGMVLDHRPALLPGVLLPYAPAQRLSQEYRALRNYLTLPRVRILKSVGDAIYHIRTSIFDHINALPNPVEAQSILDRLNLVYQNLENYEHQNNFRQNVEDLLKKTKTDIEHRRDLARIDLAIANGEGGLGNMAPIPLAIASQDTQDALRKIVGRIFVINGNDIDSTASGMICTDNSILTCSHALELDEPENECYFVPTNLLNPDSGFPNGVVDTADFCAFLRHHSTVGAANLIGGIDNNVRRIQIFLTKGHGLSVLSNNNTLADHKPLYEEENDIAIATVNRNFIGVDIHYNVNVLDHVDAGLAQIPIRFLRRNIGGAIAPIRELVPNILPINNYLALGFPGCDHLDPAGFQAFVADEGRSPFVLTQSLGHDMVLHADGRIHHRAPTAKGMSGGPLIILNGNDVHVVGVITSGNNNNEKACFLN